MLKPLKLNPDAIRDHLNLNLYRYMMAVLMPLMAWSYRSEIERQIDNPEALVLVILMPITVGVFCIILEDVESYWHFAIRIGTAFFSGLVLIGFLADQLGDFDYTTVSFSIGIYFILFFMIHIYSEDRRDEDE